MNTALNSIWTRLALVFLLLVGASPKAWAWGLRPPVELYIHKVEPTFFGKPYYLVKVVNNSKDTLRNVKHVFSKWNDKVPTKIGKDDVVVNILKIDPEGRYEMKVTKEELRAKGKFLVADRFCHIMVDADGYFTFAVFGGDFP